MSLDAAYWDARYAEANTPWDMGTPSPPLVAYLQSLPDPTVNILIPGAGSAHTAAWAYHHGFPNIHVLDWAPRPLKRFRQAVPGFPADQLIQDDFFAHTGKYAVILEQTFFCALLPAQRPQYVTTMRRLLEDGGSLAGVLFDFPLTDQGPPFGGEIETYRKLFSAHLEVELIERCRNSIPPRQGKELFFILRKKP